MRRYGAVILFLCALAVAGLSIFGDESLFKLRAQRHGLMLQKTKNQELQTEVRKLRREVDGIRKDDRELEKVARNELGLARPGEVVVVFEKRE